MICQNLMKTAKCVGPQTSVREAAQRMSEEGIGFLPVCDESGRVLGTITDRDIAMRIVATGQSTECPVDKVMTRQVIACRPTDDLHHAEELMSQAQVSRIMCVNETGLLEGVISLSDIAQVEDASRASATLRSVSGREAHA